MFLVAPPTRRLPHHTAAGEWVGRHEFGRKARRQGALIFDFLRVRQGAGADHPHGPFFPEDGQRAEALPGV